MTLAKVNAIRSDLVSIFNERDTLVDVLLRTVLSRQHGCLIGPPGTAKTALSKALVDRITGARIFSRMTRRDSTTEEFFGPYSIKGLSEDEFTRILDPKGGKAWGKKTPNIIRAHLANIEEAFKANSTVLNGLLDVLNERTFWHGDKEERCDLISAFLTSNELPQNEDLSAFWNRCLARVIVKDIQEDSSFLDFLNKKAGNNPVADSGTTMTVDELLADIDEVSKVSIPVDVNQSLVQLRRELAKIGLSPSTRRWGWVLEYLKAAAWMDGRKSVEADDFLILTEVLWERQEDIPAISQLLNGLASPDMGRIVEILDSVKAVYDGVSNGSAKNADASALLECNAKLRKAKSDLEKLEKTATSQKAKNRAKKGLEDVKAWNKNLLTRLGMGEM